ncbi:MAG TPA: type IV toxin-antitoxin system AbiEi family antitoxin domain-containing protein [Streptosporangiaceae bacterium]|nr:type IV toxin-antitoxin system AbiEi family antitoxin domain-containing protein [Streptosporangiaceae bacterium]
MLCRRAGPGRDVSGCGQGGVSGVVGRVAGVVTTGELAGAGVSRAGLRRLLRERVLVSVGRGVYAQASLAADVGREPGGEHTLRVAAALAVAGPEAVGSHRSAAVIHGLDLLGQRPARVALTRPLGAGGSRTA